MPSPRDKWTLRYRAVILDNNGVAVAIFETATLANLSQLLHDECFTGYEGADVEFTVKVTTLEG